MQVSLNGEPTGLVADVAETGEERRRGLLGREGLSPGEGLYFAPAYLIHTIGMRFHLDLVFCDRAGRVVTVRRDVPPWRFVLCRRGHGVLELPAGGADHHGIAPGDYIHLTGAPP